MIRAEVVGDIAQILREETEAGERAVKSAMLQAAVGVKAGWRARILAAGLGLRLPRTISSAVYPQARPSMNAAALIYTKAPEIIGAFATGVTIRARNAMWLAIPTVAAGSRRGGGRITPSAWEAQTGLSLRFVYRRGKPSLLVADGARINGGGRAVMSRAKVGKDGIRRGAVTAVIFVLVPQVSLRKRLDLDRDAETWAGRLPTMIVANWED